VQIELALAEQEQHDTLLRNLYQLYLYEFSRACYTHDEFTKRHCPEEEDYLYAFRSVEG
jgi:hypothetical protein